MKRVVTCLKNLILAPFCWWVRKKTGLSKTQSRELSKCTIALLYKFNGLHLKRSAKYLRLMLNQINWKEFNLTEDLFRQALKDGSAPAGYTELQGAWFTIDSQVYNRSAPRVENTDTITYYGSGREPFLALANQQSRKVVMLPYFTCFTVFQPFLENGWEIVHYKVDRDLRMDCREVLALAEKHRPAIAVFMEYSGIDLNRRELDTIGVLKNSGCVTVVDRTQNIYSTVKSPEVDYYCGSLRKWFCIPDGGYLEKNSNLPLPPAPDAGVCNDVYATANSVKMFTAGIAREKNSASYMELSNFFYTLATSYICGQPVRARNMSDYSRAVYMAERSKDDDYIQRRRENFRYILEHIADCQSVQPVCKDCDLFTAAPLYFHVYAKNRSGLTQYLKKRGIKTWINWTKPNHLGVVDGQSDFIFNHILSLCCDQRYTQEDMSLLCDAIKAYDEHETAKNDVHETSYMQETVDKFLKMPIDSADQVLETFAQLPGAVVGKGSAPMERYVYVPGSRTDRILLVAHADTVWDQQYGNPAQQEIVLENGIYRGTNPNCGIGADDRAGCAMLWALKDSGHSLLVLDGEEHGKIGARYLRDSDPKLYKELNHHRFMMEFDWTRPGGCLYSQVKNTQKFKKYIKTALGCTDDHNNGGCDLQILCRRICGVNIGIGYKNNHKPEEVLVLDGWVKACKKISEFLRPEHPCFKIPAGKRFWAFFRRMIRKVVKK